MSTVPLTPPGNLLQDLLGNWKREFPKRAAGGWWALSGFALQTSVYLLRFFQQLEKGVEPGLLAEMEHLSDILCPADGKLTLIQVKRTLTRHALISAVEEAYLITDLCRRHTPALINHLRFQIACKERVTDTQVADLSMPQVTTSGGDVASWNAMLACFDELAPITEEPDALDQLYALLWNAGIRNTHALIERCVGRLLMNFGASDPTAMRQVGRELADFFFAAERHDKWDPVGTLLTDEDTVPDSKAPEYTDVLTGQQPRLEHLMKGFFRDRPQIFQDLSEAFTRWVTSLDHLEREINDKIPVFWISGRSGEGKSVLLVQLVAEALRSNIVSPLLQLKAGDDLPRLVATVPDRAHLSDRSFGRVFVVVDDVYDLHRYERGEWDAIILNECEYRPPPIALITCGPTEQKEQFTARLSGSFEVTSFEVPVLSVEECHAFLTWYESRTGQAREWSELTIENPLLVQLMFELAHGERMPEFARRFKKRLIDINIFDEARAILAVNALYLDAPLGLITSNESRDALEYLCRDEQLHFRVTYATDEVNNAGVRMAHSHLAWLLFIEWVEPSPTTFAKAWARELFKSLSIFEEMPTGPTAGSLLNQLLHTTRLADTGASESESPAANRDELIRELYRLSSTHHSGCPSPRTLARWLELEYELPSLQLNPDPAQCAAALFSDPALAPSVHGWAIFWLWLIAESRMPEEAQEMHDAAKEFSLEYSDNSAIGSAIAWLLGKRRNDADVLRFAHHWLGANLRNTQAFHLLMSLVATNPSDEGVIQQTFDWLAVNGDHPMASLPLAGLVANSLVAEVRMRAADWLTTHEANPSSHDVIAALVAADKNNVRMREHALNWLAANEKHPRAYSPLSALISARPGDAEVRALAFDWLAKYGSHKNAYQVLAALVAASQNDVDVFKHAFDWLAANDTLPYAEQVLRPLVAANPSDAETQERDLGGIPTTEKHPQDHQSTSPPATAHSYNAEVKERAFDWLAANKTHPNAHQVIATLMTANPNNAEVKQRAFDWLAANETHSHAHQLIATLVTSNPNDAEVKERALDWLATNEMHPQANQLIATLVAANPTVIEAKKLAVDWLTANETHPRFHDLLAVMIARSDGSKEWLDRGENYVKKADSVHSERIVGVLLTAGKADPKYIEMAFDFMEGTTVAAVRSSILYHLSRALVRNFHNAVQYLNGPYDEQRKKTVCTSIAFGMNRFTDTIAAFALDVVPRIDADHVYNILRNVITRQLENDYLDEMIVQWLVDNYRRQGYGGMLNALHKNPVFWERIRALATLPKRIVQDFAAWNV